jgi:hypothetical protein
VVAMRVLTALVTATRKKRRLYGFVTGDNNSASIGLTTLIPLSASRHIIGAPPTRSCGDEVT